MYWFVVFVGYFDYLGELGIVFGVFVYVVGIDMVFGECLGVIWIVG